jgi:hypothetical protein
MVYCVQLHLSMSNVSLARVTFTQSTFCSINMCSDVCWSLELDGIHQVKAVAVLSEVNSNGEEELEDNWDMIE